MQCPARDELHLWLCHRDQGLSSEQFLREVVARYSGLAPDALSFERGPQGKPELTSPRLKLAFNLSDCRDWLVLALSAGHPVGVDLEFCDDRRDLERLARRSYSDLEIQQLESCPINERVDRFYELWTLKEAAVKAAGRSLGRELERTHFKFCSATPQSRETSIRQIVPHLPAWGAGAWLALLQPLEHYRLALCCLSQQDFSRGMSHFIWPDDVAVKSGLRLLATTESIDASSGESHI